MGFPCGSAGKESVCNVGDLGSIPGLGRSPEDGKGYLLQYSGLNCMDCIVHGVAKSQTRVTFIFTFIAKYNPNFSNFYSLRLKAGSHSSPHVNKLGLVLEPTPPNLFIPCPQGICHKITGKNPHTVDTCYLKLSWAATSNMPTSPWKKYFLPVCHLPGPPRPIKPPGCQIVLASLELS